MWLSSLPEIGVGHLHLLDFDRVDITNLNRQQYFMRHIGMYKNRGAEGGAGTNQSIPGPYHRLYKSDRRKYSSFVCGG